MRKALIVGIDYYDSVGCLGGCVRDAYNVKAMLDRHSDGKINFQSLLKVAPSAQDRVTQRELRTSIQDLFEGDSDIALLYFAGHGYVETTGGYLCASDVETGDDGISLNDIMVWANQSEAKNKVIILDSCHSGVLGTAPLSQVAELSEGVTILTASTKEQYAQEVEGAGVFTTLLVDALGGAAANLVGEITPGSVYAHIDQSLGPWAQRPVFKTNVKSFVSLRTAQPPLELADLQKITRFFPMSGYEYQLDPTFEPERNGNEPVEVPSPDIENTQNFAVLQKFNRVNLVVPVGATHMWHAAMESKSCKLTALGEHYRRLVAEGML